MDCKSKETIKNLEISNKRCNDPDERAKYKAQLAKWKLLHPGTRAASLFFSLHEKADVSVEVWLRDNRDSALSAIEGLDKVTGMEIEVLLMTWLQKEEDLVFFDIEKLLGGKHVSDLDRLLQLGMTVGDYSLNIFQANEDIYNLADTNHSGAPVDPFSKSRNNGILENVSDTICDNAKTKLFFSKRY